MNQKQADLGSGRVGKLLFSLALPTITSQIVNMLYNLVDRVYIGHMKPVDTVGALALTGVGVCLPVIMIISAFAALVGILAAQVGAISKVLTVFGIDSKMAAVVAISIIILYTSFSGMWGVALTDVVQLVVIFIGVPLTTVIGMAKIGGQAVCHGCPRRTGHLPQPHRHRPGGYGLHRPAHDCL